MKSVDRQTRATESALALERAHLRSLRRMLTSGSAILGILPFMRATAPAFVPRLVAGLSAIWSAMLCTLFAIVVQELLLWRESKRFGRFG